MTVSFDLALPPRVCFGPGRADDLAGIVAALGSRVLVVTGSSPARVESVVAPLRAGAKAQDTVTIAAEPTVDDARRATAAGRELEADVVVAIGGGSVIDLGKATAMLLGNGGDPMDYIEVVGRGDPIAKPPLPLVAVPTTAGTGAEVTANAVLSVPDHAVKASLRHPLMIPWVAVIDPDLTIDCPPAVTAAAGMDALTQCLEPYVSSRANPMTDSWARTGMMAAGRSLMEAYWDGSNTQARADMALCSLDRAHPGPAADPGPGQLRAQARRCPSRRGPGCARQQHAGQPGPAEPGRAGQDLPGRAVGELSRRRGGSGFGGPRARARSSPTWGPTADRVTRVFDRYGSDVLAAGRHPRTPTVPEISGEPDLVVECASSGWCGAIVGWEKTTVGWSVVLEDRHGRRRLFPEGPAAFLVDGRPVTLTRPRRALAPAPPGAARTASGSIAVPRGPARVARDSRIWVEGTHDAELVEKVWGADLRELGIVVEPLGGIDDLLGAVSSFGPGPGRRLVVLVDHLVAGTKESRIGEDVTRRWAPHVTVLGHPYVDVWQAVRPRAVGIERWPSVPRGQSWKAGVCAALGWPPDQASAWRRILGSVRTYADLDPALLARVEEAIDIVTESEE